VRRSPLPLAPFRSSPRFSIPPLRSDQRITQDTQKFADSFSALYSSIFKPVMDVILLTRRLANVVGLRGPMMMYLYYFLSAILLRLIMPPFAKLTADQQKLEGDFRYAHSRLINYAEEIAFYGGNTREKNFLNSVFDKLFNHSASIFTKQASLGVFDSWLVKYGATMIGYAVVALPVFSSLGMRMYGAAGAEGRSKITRDYVRNSSILINLARAIGQLILLYKTTTQLAGYTARVAELREVLLKFNKDEADASQGSLSEGDNISFQDVSIVSPDNVVLLDHLNFEVNPGDNTLIVGPNGCGKSSLFRLVGGLWPIRVGRVVRPSAADMFYIPQRPYLTTGTLRQQVIYPHSEQDMARRGIDDAKLLKLLEEVDVKYIVDREGWDKELDWDETLSQGEQQRVAMARLFYHCPKYAILDECTSQLSLDIEAFLYQRCQQLGITLITVAHRKSLWKYHKKILIMSGVGTYVWRDLLPEEVSEESNDQGFGTPTRKM
jgi:ATP-binding cassette, subfamily D (ALD), member 3